MYGMLQFIKQGTIALICYFIFPTLALIWVEKIPLFNWRETLATCGNLLKLESTIDFFLVSDKLETFSGEIEK